MSPGLSEGSASPSESIRAAEVALARMGYRRVERDPAAGSAFWVEDTEGARHAIPVYVWNGPGSATAPAAAGDRTPSVGRAILVVPTDGAAEAFWGPGPRRGAIGSDLRVLVVPPAGGNGPKPHWHALVLSPRELLDVATGVVVGLFRRAQATEGASEVDFQEMLRLLRQVFRIDLYASLGVDSDEAVLFLLYQLAQKYTFAPGDASAQIHTLVLRPTGPAARLPWFAA